MERRGEEKESERQLYMYLLSNVYLVPEADLSFSQRQTERGWKTGEQRRTETLM